MYKKVIKPILFLIHPDFVHSFIVKLGHYLGFFWASRLIVRKLFYFSDERLSQEFWGINFKNPIGLAGGFDKNAQLIKIIPEVGFGFMEVGSITRFPYKGNKRPWSTRLPKDSSLLVNYGLKNYGVDIIRNILKKTPRKIPLIVNIAKTNDRSISGKGTIDDYIVSYSKLEPLTDIVNINISCPNTGDGVLLCEDMGLLNQLLVELQDAYDRTEKKKPIVVKLKPDLSIDQLKDIVDSVRKYPCVSGFIISNLSKDRSLLVNTPIEEHENFKGGVSGKPIKDLSTQMIRDVRQLVGSNYIIIGCGGIFSAEDAYEKLKAGADLIEIVTSLVYEGPSVVKKINRGLIEIMDREGISKIQDIPRIW